MAESIVKDIIYPNASVIPPPIHNIAFFISFRSEDIEAILELENDRS